jgi:hypothetical protein
MDNVIYNSGRAVVISCVISFRVDLMIYFSSLEHKKEKVWILRIALPSGGDIQDGRQTRMFRNSVSFQLNHLKLWI